MLEGVKNIFIIFIIKEPHNFTPVKNASNYKVKCEVEQQLEVILLCILLCVLKYIVMVQTSKPSFSQSKAELWGSWVIPQRPASNSTPNSKYEMAPECLLGNVRGAYAPL